MGPVKGQGPTRSQSALAFKILWIGLGIVPAV